MRKIHFLTIVTPVLDDWESLNVLIREIEADAFLQDWYISLIVVDDGSSKTVDTSGVEWHPRQLTIHFVRLRANVGHQRAIALGLAYAARQRSAGPIIVMDADGEDDPHDLHKLLAAHNQHSSSLICAARARRSEGFVFKMFYAAYKMLFRALTGSRIMFGNFSLIPRERLNLVLCSSGIWNNFAASVLRCRVSRRFVDTCRGRRYAESSRMNFVALMVHGLSAVSVYSDVVIGRIIIVTSAFAAALAVAVVGIVVAKLTSDQFIPGYATSLVLFLFSIALNTILLGMVLVMLLLNNRTLSSALPTRMLDDLVEGVTRVEPSAPAQHPQPTVLAIR
jgi:polyisoprenyl-phosphate glycosyltransferase